MNVILNALSVAFLCILCAFCIIHSSTLHLILTNLYVFNFEVPTSYIQMEYKTFYQIRRVLVIRSELHRFGILENPIKNQLPPILVLLEFQIGVGWACIYLKHWSVTLAQNETSYVLIYLTFFFGTEGDISKD